MVRTYKKRTERQSNEEGTKAAVEDVVDKHVSIRAAAAKHGVKKSRLGYLVKKAKQHGTDNTVYTTNFKSRQVFPDKIEKSLCEYLLNCSNMFYGLTPTMTRKLAYQYAKMKGMHVPPSWDGKEQAGEDWFQAFMKRQPNLPIRTPEATSLVRMFAFNRHTVTLFFDKLESVMKRYNFRANHIFNLDETSVTSSTVVGQMGRKQIGQVTSRERGELITQVGIICADGKALPPAWVFPRVHFNEKLMSGAAAGALGLVHELGCMTSENFLKVLEFFKENVRCSKENPVLLIMDNHESHLSIPGLEFCKENGIVVLTFPPHTSNKLQPLDRCIFDSFKKIFSSAVNSWMNSNPNTLLDIYALPKLCSFAWNRATTPENVKSGFKAAGIVPFDRNIFTDQDFLSSAVSDRPLVGANESRTQATDKSSQWAKTSKILTISGSSSATITDTFTEVDVVLPEHSSSSEDDNVGLCEELGESPVSFSLSSEESHSETENEKRDEESKGVDFVTVKFPQKNL